MDKWQKGRDVHFKKTLNGESKFYNFDYRKLWQIFQEKNIEAIEKDENKTILEDFCKENKYFPRVISGNYYVDWVQKTFYCALTILKRVGQNNVLTLWGSCDNYFPNFLNFYLGNHEDQWAEEMEKRWGDYLAADYGIGGIDPAPEGFIDDIED